MIFYIILFFICIFINVKFKSKVASIISFIILWIVYAFRDCVGVDDITYIQAFNDINLGWKYDIEISYKILAKLAYGLGLNYKFVFLIYATGSMYFLYKSADLIFKDNNRGKALYLACFFGTAFVSSMSIMRQFLAACIVFYAILDLQQNKHTIKSLMLCLLATFFHMGAILSIPFLIWIKQSKNIKYSTKLILIISSVIIGYMNISNDVLNLIMKFLPNSYQLYNDSISGSFSSAGGIISLILLTLYIIQCCIYKKNSENNVNNVLEIGQLVYLCLLFAFVHAGVASRLAFTFMLFVCTIPITFTERIKKEQQRYLKIIIVILMFVLYLLSLQKVSNQSNGRFIPYTGSFNFFNRNIRR